ncbi:MAG: hypothetical protein ACKVOM_09860 [Ferruginibacter sp.]
MTVKNGGNTIDAVEGLALCVSHCISRACALAGWVQIDSWLCHTASSRLRDSSGKPGEGIVLRLCAGLATDSPTQRGSS